jgi:hypothetical protein
VNVASPETINTTQAVKSNPNNLQKLKALNVEESKLLKKQIMNTITIMITKMKMITLNNPKIKLKIIISPKFKRTNFKVQPIKIATILTMKTK